MTEQQWMRDFVERYDRETANPSWLLKSNTSSDDENVTTSSQGTSTSRDSLNC